MIVENSIALGLARRVWRGSRLVELARACREASGAVWRGSRLADLLRVEDYLGRDLTPLAGLIAGSRAFRKFFEQLLALAGKISARFAGSGPREMASSAGFIRLARNLGRAWAGRALAAAILVTAVCCIVRLSLILLDPQFGGLVPWSAAPVLGLLAALLVRRLAPQAEAGPGLIERTAGAARKSLAGLKAFASRSQKAPGVSGAGKSAPGRED